MAPTTRSAARSRPQAKVSGSDANRDEGGGDEQSEDTATGTTAAQPDVSSGPRRRRQPKGKAGQEKMDGDHDDDYDRHDDPLLPIAEGRDGSGVSAGKALKGSGWIGLAIASGACAAFNGVFAKLTTTELTASMARGIARGLGTDDSSHVVELVIRCAFFGLNIVFNGVMWSLFTAALSRGTSTTQVSIVNTSTNFMATALLGLAIFAEALPPLWWLGASMLVAGNVIIGRSTQEDEAKTGPFDVSDRVRADDTGASAVDTGVEERYRDVPVSDVPAARKDDQEDIVPLVDLDDR